MSPYSKTTRPASTNSRQLAGAKLNDAAKASDLARHGEENTRQMLTTLARSLGFTDVTATLDAQTLDTAKRANVNS